MSNAFYRDRSKGVIAGVCAGLAEYFGVTAVLLRLIFVLLAFSGGPAVLAYMILWIVLPDKATLGIAHRDTMRENVQDIRSQARSLGQQLQGALGGRRDAAGASSHHVLWLGGTLIVIGLVSLGDALNLLSWFHPRILWAMALILAGVVMLSRAVHTK